MRQINRILRTYLIFPLLLLASCAEMKVTYYYQSDETMGRHRPVLNAFTALIDQHFAKVLGELKTLAASKEVQTRNWDTMQGLLRVAQDNISPGIVWYAETNGSYYTIAQGKAREKVNDRPYFSHLISGEVVTGAFVVGKSTNKKSFVVAIPLQQNGNVVGALGASVFLDELSLRLNAEMALPDDTFFFTLASSGTTALHRDINLIFQDPRQQGSESLSKAVETMLAASEGEVTYEYEGKQRRAIFRTSPFTGWHCVISVSRSEAKQEQKK